MGLKLKKRSKNYILRVGAHVSMKYGPFETCWYPHMRLLARLCLTSSNEAGRDDANKLKKILMDLNLLYLWLCARKFYKRLIALPESCTSRQRLTYLSHQGF